MAVSFPKVPWLRYGAFLPALILGTWLIVYTQRQAAKSVDARASSGSSEDLTPDTFPIDLNLAPEVFEFEGSIKYGKPINPLIALSPPADSPHVIRVTSKRIEMPIFNTRNLKSLLLAEPGSLTGSGRKGWEQHVADLIDGVWGISASKPLPENPASRDPFNP